jgi:transglutaminase-like putative cysteine protease
MRYWVASLVMAVSVYGQDFKLGKVTADELAQKYHPSDTSAPAAILFKDCKVTLAPDRDGNWVIEEETRVKIKIYKKTGYDYGNFEGLLYTGMRTDKLSFHDETTYNLVGGKVEKTKRKSGSEFDEKQSKYYSLRKMAMPNVREGSIVEYRYIKTSHLGGSLDKFYMQYPIPADHVRYTVVTPDMFTFNRIIGGYLSPSQKTQKTDFYGQTYEVNNDVYQLSNVPAMRDEFYVDNINNYRSHIKYEISMYKGRTRIDFANTWEDVVKNIYENDDFGKQLERKNYFEADLTPVLAGATDNNDLMLRVFNFVQNRMSWNDYLGYLTDKGVKQAYTERTGNVADINLMLVAMLRHAGLSANPVLVSTRSNGVNIFPSRTAYNYVVAAVEVQDGLILLDATSKNTRPNILPYRAVNWSGRIIRSYGSSAEVELRPKEMSKEVNYIMGTVAPDGVISGKVRRQYTDYVAYSFRENNGGLAKDSYLEKLENRFKGIEVDEYEVTNVKDVTKPIMETYSFTHNNVADVIGDKLYINPLLFFTFDESPFKQDERRYPVDFVYPTQDRYNVTMTLADGLQVETVPKPVTYAMEDNLGIFKFNCSAAGNQIQISATYEMAPAMLPAEYYPSLKRFFAEMISKQTDKIVLKRI